MKSKNIHYIPGVDHLRAFAALLVVLFHGVLYIHHRLAYGRGFDDSSWLEAPNPLAAMVIEGHTAVALFFVLSGFIFTVGSLGRPMVYRRFIANRFLRTYPLFLLFILLSVLIYPENFNLLALLKSVFFLANLPTALNGGPFTFVAWSIAIEWQFYLVFPLLIALVNRFGVMVILLLIVAGVLLRAALYSPDTDMRLLSYWSMAGRMDQFLMGMVAGWFYRNHFQVGKIMDCVGIVGWVLIFLILFFFNRLGGGSLTDHTWIWWPTLEALGWSIVVVGYMSLSQRIPQLISRVLIYLGTISYSVYLIHYVVLFYLMENDLDATLVAGGPVDTALLNTLVLVVPPVILLAAVSYKFIEKPFLGLRGIYLGKGSTS